MQTASCVLRSITQRTAPLTPSSASMMAGRYLTSFLTLSPVPTAALIWARIVRSRSEGFFRRAWRAAAGPFSRQGSLGILDAALLSVDY